MRILVACDKLKGSLTADEACQAIERGLRRIVPEAEVELLPMADGGEGFADAVARSLDGDWVPCPARDARGRPIDARYLLVDHEGTPTAVMEMSEAAGLWRLAEDERDPLTATTSGVGDMMLHAVEASDVHRIVVGIGGSATNDGGAGMAHALGVRFLARDGTTLDPVPQSLRELDRIDLSRRLILPPVTVACDVDSPLLGPKGATRVFGPQKGAREKDLPLLEDALGRLVRAAGATGQADKPGAGAAGGLGFGLLVFAGAELEPGFDLLARLTGIEAAISSADLVITGEGSLDAQSLAGKGPVALARLAARHGKPAVAFCGRSDEIVRRDGPFRSVHALADTGLPVEDLMTRAAELLEEAAAGADFSS